MAETSCEYVNSGTANKSRDDREQVVTGRPALNAGIPVQWRISCVIVTGCFRGLCVFVEVNLLPLPAIL